MTASFNMIYHAWNIISNSLHPVYDNEKQSKLVQLNLQLYIGNEKYKKDKMKYNQSMMN
jgi:hypothetical protein